MRIPSTAGRRQKAAQQRSIDFHARDMNSPVSVFTLIRSPGVM